jgi:hypothetical protein
MCFGLSEKCVCGKALCVVLGLFLLTFFPSGKNRKECGKNRIFSDIFTG